jgi:hypothetical protein
MAQAVVLTRLPLELVLPSLLASDCRKLLSCEAISLLLLLLLLVESVEADDVLPPPSAVSRFENEDSSAVVASLPPSLAVVVSPLPVPGLVPAPELVSLASFEIRLCRSDSRPPAPPGPPEPPTGGGGGALSLSDEDDEDDEDASPCPCRLFISAAINDPSACATSVLLVVLLSLSDVVALVLLVLLVLPVLLLAVLVALSDELVVTPIACSAEAMASMKLLPSGLSGGAPRAPPRLALLVVPLPMLLVLLSRL